MDDLKCMFGLHHYKEEYVEYLVNPYQIKIGTVIVSRCQNCGKIKQTIVYTDNNYRRL